MQCPVCETSLIIVERHKIELDYCMKCKGLWFDSGELNLMSEALGVDIHFEKDIDTCPAVSSPQKPYRCPRCRKSMNKINFSSETSTVVDKCPNGDGLWFDHGELEQVLQSGRESQGAVENKILAFLQETFGAKKT